MPAYVMRSQHILFKQGDREPWTHLLEHDQEREILPEADLADGTLATADSGKLGRAEPDRGAVARRGVRRRRARLMVTDAVSLPLPGTASAAGSRSRSQRSW
jgi:hypothetical protein